jgi:16S rRNA U1498 N3-methylase RsmE
VAVGWVAVRAGETVLRTVNAGVVLTAAVMALTGRFDRPIAHDPPVT